MKINTALILCAGFGKRLKPLTLKTPKPLLELNNKTMLEHCIDMIIKLEIKKILLNTFHLGNQISEFIKKKKFPIEIEIIDDGKEILNTGGGILNMINHSKDKDFLIFNPDTLWQKDYVEEIYKMQKLYFSQKLNNVLLLADKDLSYDKKLDGDFKLENNIIKKNARNDFIYIGCQILNKSLFEKYELCSFSIKEVWDKLLIENKLNGFQSKNNFYHLTNLEMFKKLKDF